MKDTLITSHYQGDRYDSPGDAIRAAIIDWATACGKLEVEEAAANIEANFEEAVTDFAESGWNVPNVGQPSEQEARELLLDFIGEFT